jgi:hypothetical protein
VAQASRLPSAPLTNDRQLRLYLPHPCPRHPSTRPLALGVRSAVAQASRSPSPSPPVAHNRDDCATARLRLTGRTLPWALMVPSAVAQAFPLAVRAANPRPANADDSATERGLWSAPSVGGGTERLGVAVQSADCGPPEAMGGKHVTKRREGGEPEAEANYGPPGAMVGKQVSKRAEGAEPEAEADYGPPGATGGKQVGERHDRAPSIQHPASSIQPLAPSPQHPAPSIKYPAPSPQPPPLPLPPDRHQRYHR